MLELCCELFPEAIDRVIAVLEESERISVDFIHAVL
jgi:hypothetical protein